MDMEKKVNVLCWRRMELHK